MATSNSVYFDIVDVPALEAVGWEVTVADYKDFTTYVCDINDYISLSVNPVINEYGQGSISMSLSSPLWDSTLGNGLPATDLLDGEYLFQCWEDGVLRFEFLGAQVTEGRIDSSEDPMVTISGPGSAGVFEWAELFPYQFPKPKKYNPELISNPDDWNFTKRIAMPLWIQLLKASQSRGVIPYVKYSFTDKKDSSGVPWADIKRPISYQFNFGTSLTDMLNTFTGQDTSVNAGIRADWYMRPKFVLDVRQNFGNHLETQVIFFDGEVTEKKRDRDRSSIANFITLTNEVGDFSSSYSPSSIDRWQKREHIEERDGLWDVPRRSGVANVLQQQLSKEDSSWVIRIPYNREGRRPFKDFDIGDWIGISISNATQWNKVEAYRVMSITIQISADGTIESELELESIWKNQKRKLSEKIQSIIATPPKGNVSLPNTKPSKPIPVVYDPEKGIVADPSYSFGSGNLWIQPTDPALDKNNTVNPGDFWIMKTEDTP